MGDYLRPARLQEIIGLIRASSTGPLNPQESGLRHTLHGTPTSATGWVPLAAEHPEFFRATRTVANTDAHSATLWSRFNREDGQVALPDDQIEALINQANQFHEREARAREIMGSLERLERESKQNRRLIMVSVMGSVISAFGAIIAAVIGILAKK